MVVEYKGYQMDLSNYYFGLVLSEWYDRWTKAYIPRTELRARSYLTSAPAKAKPGFSSSPTERVGWSA